MVAEHKSSINEVNICLWKNDFNFIFFCKAPEYITYPKEGRYPQVSKAVLYIFFNSFQTLGNTTGDSQKRVP